LNGLVSFCGKTGYIGQTVFFKYFGKTNVFGRFGKTQYPRGIQPLSPVNVNREYPPAMAEIEFMINPQFQFYQNRQFYQ
jgi:hypothetical protein